MTDGPHDTGSAAPKSRVRSGFLRFLEIVLVWALIVGFFALLGWGITGVVRDSLPKIDRTLAALKAAREDPDLMEVQKRTVNATDDVEGEALTPVERAPSEDVGGVTITNPSWRVLPQPLYPDDALVQGKEGEATLACRVNVQGVLEGCTVVEETPTGLGFGAAALASATDARLAPRTVDGVAVAGTVRFAVHFNLPDPVRIVWPWEHPSR